MRFYEEIEGGYVLSIVGGMTFTDYVLLYWGAILVIQEHHHCQKH